MNTRRTLVALTIVGLGMAALFLPLWAWKKNQVRVEQEAEIFSTAVTGIPPSPVSDTSVVFLALGIGGAVVGGVAGVLLVANYSKVESGPTDAAGQLGTRPCPYCAEHIQQAAVICRFCGREVEPL